MHIHVTSAGNREGGILAVVLVVLVVVSAMAAGIMRISSGTSLESSKSATALQAFWVAEAGVAHAKAVALNNKALKKSRIFPAAEPRNWSGQMESGSYEVSVDELFTHTNPAYRVTAEGVSRGKAIAAVEVLVRQMPVISAGIFGDRIVGLQPNTDIKGFSSSDHYPPLNSVGGSLLASNHEIDMQPGVTVYGTILLGEQSDGTVADFTGGDDYSTEPFGYIDPDPLGAIGGPLAADFARAAYSNDNSAISAYVTRSGEFKINDKDTLTLPNGDYYFSKITIEGSLVSTGAVNIYLTGSMSAKSGSSIALSGSVPGDFRIYSNSTAPIRIQPKGSFAGFVYAPYSSSILIQPQNNFIGALWGSSITLQPGGDIWIDNDLLSYGAFTTYRVTQSDWKRVGRLW
jgi:hypothetical protein